VQVGAAPPVAQKEMGMHANRARSVPDGYHSVTPFVIVKGAARFLDFMADAFDAKEMGRVTGADGAIGHVETRIGDSVVMTFDSKEDWPATPAFL
jgi:PhnB protein